jgi:hypothetical protein
VPAREKAGATSPGLLRGGREYRVTVSGTWTNGQGGVADAECAVSGGSWRRDLDSYDMEIGDWSYDRLSPNVWNVRSTPVNGGSDCDSRHAYTFVYRPDHTTPLNIRVTDPSRYTDNVGALRVTVAPNDGSAPGQPVPTPAPAPEQENLEVDSHSPEPVRTQQSYPAGTSLRVTATGTYTLRGGDRWAVADAECTVDSSDSYWRSSRYYGSFGGSSDAPLGDLVVNGVIGTWQPVNTYRSCDRYEHEYTYDLVTREDGPLSFVIADDDYSDNDGKLQVEVAPR